MAKAIAKSLTEKRIDQLEEVGYNFNEAENRYENKESFYQVEDIEKFSEAEWDTLIKGFAAEEDKKNNFQLAKIDQAVINVDFAAEAKILEDFKDKAVTFKRKFGPTKLLIKGVDDKAGLEKNQQAGRELLAFRQEIEEYIEGKTRPHLDTVKWYKDNLGALVKVIKELQDAAKEKRDAHKELVLQEKNKEEKRLKDLLANRIDILIKAGMVFDGAYYSVGNEEFDVPATSLGALDIQTMTDAVWNEQLNIIKTKVETIATKQTQKDADEATRKQEEEAETNRIKNENIERAKEIAETRGELLTMQGMVLSEDKTMYAYAEEGIKAKVTTEFLGTASKAEWDVFYTTLKTDIATLKESAAKLKAFKEKREARVKELSDLGLVWNAGKMAFVLNDISIDTDYVNDAAAGEWEETVADVKQKIVLAKELARIKDERHKQLIDLGLIAVKPYEIYEYRKQAFTVAECITKDHAETWNTCLDNIKNEIQEIDDAVTLQAQRLAELSPFLIFGHTINTLELYKLEQEAYDKLLAETKQAHADKVSNDAQEAINKKAKEDAEKLAKSSDEEKWAHFINSIPEPSEMDSEDFKGYAKQAIELINKIKAIV